MQTLKCAVSLAVVGLATVLGPGCSRAAAQEKFATPEAAAAALHQALNASTLEPMKSIFGGAWIESAASGDPVADQHDREVLALAMGQSWRWGPRGENGKELIVGEEQWPFPVPLVQSGYQWQFDSEAGQEEVLARRIGGNELGVIRICGDYVRAQKEYASLPHDGKPAGRFAQQFRSSPGRQDGLFWRQPRGEKPSPFGRLVAAGIQEGYDPGKPDASPFRGYRFRILTAQGPAAPGGKKSYLVNGEMSGGFALLAFPAKYGFSGIMTFVVGPDGVVYEKDFGKETATEAARLVEYNPDSSWKAVQVAVSKP